MFDLDRPVSWAERRIRDLFDVPKQVTTGDYLIAWLLLLFPVFLLVLLVPLFLAMVVIGVLVLTFGSDPRQVDTWVIPTARVVGRLREASHLERDP